VPARIRPNALFRLANEPSASLELMILKVLSVEELISLPLSEVPWWNETDSKRAEPVRALVASGVTLGFSPKW